MGLIVAFYCHFEVFFYENLLKYYRKYSIINNKEIKNFRV